MQTDVGGMITARILDELSCWCRDKADYEQFSYVVDVFVVLPLLAFGLAGNTLSGAAPWQVALIRRPRPTGYDVVQKTGST